jgi:hypothetical protein
MARRSPWRTPAVIVAILVGLAWIGASGWWVIEAWPMRATMGRVDLARAENQCNARSGSAANQARCRDLVELMHRAEQAQDYFIDGILVFGPPILLFGIVYWRSRRHPPRRGGTHHPPPQHHHRPSAA